MQLPVSSLSSDSTVPHLREVSFTSKISSPGEASMKQLQSPKRDAKERLKGISDAARIQFYQMKGICTDVEVKYFKTLKKIFDVNMCKDHTALEGRKYMPLTTDGSWIHVWIGPGLSIAMKIEFGQCLFLRGDVVHAGGRAMVDNVKSFYPRLHFYLPTKLQPAPIN